MAARRARGVVAQLADLRRRLVDEAQVVASAARTEPERNRGSAAARPASRGDRGIVEVAGRGPSTSRWSPAESRPRTSRRSRRRQAPAGSDVADLDGRPRRRPRRRSRTACGGGQPVVAPTAQSASFSASDGGVGRLEGSRGTRRRRVEPASTRGGPVARRAQHRQPADAPASCVTDHQGHAPSRPRSTASRLAARTVRGRRIGRDHGIAAPSRRAAGSDPRRSSDVRAGSSAAGAGPHEGDDAAHG